MKYQGTGTDAPVLRDPRAIALLLAATLTVMANATISPALPGLAAMFRDDPNADLLTRMLVTAPSLSIALLAPFVGLAIDRLGRRVLLLLGIALFVAAGTAGLYLPSLPAIFASRVILGVAVALIMTTQTALIGDYFTGKKRSSLSGLQIAARNFGGLVFILLAGWAAALSPRYAFGVYGLALLVLPLVWVAIVEPNRSQNAETARPVDAASRDDWRLRFFGLVLMQSLTNMFFFIMPTQLPFFLAARGYDSATTTGLTLGVLMLTGGAVAMLYTTIQKTVGYAGVFALGYGSMAAGFLLLIVSPSLPLILVGAALVGAGYAAVSPTFVTLTLNLAPPHRRGLAGGLLTASIFIGQFLSPLLSTPVSLRFGYDGLFLGTVVLLAIVAGSALAVGLRTAAGNAMRFRNGV